MENKSYQQKDRLFNALNFFNKIFALKNGVTRNNKSAVEDILNGLFIFFALFCGILTAASLLHIPPFGNNPEILMTLLKLDVAILAIFAILYVRRILMVLKGREKVKGKGAKGVRIEKRLVVIFGVLALMPAVLMAIFSLMFFHYGVQSWFNERVRSAVNNANAVAEAYLDEHYKVVQADILAAANDFDRQAALISANPNDVKRILETQSNIRNFSEIILMTSHGEIIEEYGLINRDRVLDILNSNLNTVNDGSVAIIADRGLGRVHAAVKLNNFIDIYMIVGRFVDPLVLAHVAKTREASEEYAYLEGQHAELGVTVTLIYTVVALILIATASWLGLHFARQIVSPISDMMQAAERVSAGDLSVKLNEQTKFKDFSYLAQSFNIMTNQIEEQRNELILANRQLDTRRRFTEGILTAASHGIIAVNKDNKITLANAHVSSLFEQDESALVGTCLDTYFSDFSSYLEKARSKPGEIIQFEISIESSSLGVRTLLVRIAAEMDDDENLGAVITIDDITELQSVQRKAAWSDVARRIAHEIKNPLTPIQLSAERLQRKYSKHIKEDDREIFELCVSTIIKHVGDIGHMVKEFSSFARMPEPKMANVDPIGILKDVITLEDHAHDKVDIILTKIDPKISNDSAQIFADSQQLRQVFTNILQNAIEAIQSSDQNDILGRVNIYVFKNKDRIFFIFQDNGTGFPKDVDRSKLTEPYVTHKEKGTGLGLAIVKKIIEDHEGSLYMGIPEFLSKLIEQDAFSIDNRDDIGATVVVSLPTSQLTTVNSEQDK